MKMKNSKKNNEYQQQTTTAGKFFKYQKQYSKLVVGERWDGEEWEETRRRCEPNTQKGY